MPSATEIRVEKVKLKKPPLQMHYLGDKVLRQEAKRISKVDDALRQVIRQMLQTMYSEDGIGLAAPQVGIHKQLIVIDIDPEEASTAALILLNPKLERFGAEMSAYQEGCLSIPGVYLDVQRPEVVEVSFKDENGRPRRLKADGLLSRCIQHEMDHLNGVLFVDRVENRIQLDQELHKQGFDHQAVRPLV
jgi:peptide deformylase